MHTIENRFTSHDPAGRGPSFVKNASFLADVSREIIIAVLTLEGDSRN